MAPRTGLRAYWRPDSPTWWLSAALGSILSFLMLNGQRGL